MSAIVTEWHLEVDVAVMGSGGAGLTAAILAHDGGARVALLERSGHIGGTTAVSGGGLIIPMHPHQEQTAGTDTREKALTYCKHLAAGRAPDAMIERFVDQGPEMVRYLEQHTSLVLEANTTPDYRAEAPGALGEARF